MLASENRIRGTLLAFVMGRDRLILENDTKLKEEACYYQSNISDHSQALQGHDISATNILYYSRENVEL